MENVDNSKKMATGGSLEGTREGTYGSSADGVCFLGIDIGTYSSKGVLVDRNGIVIARKTVPHDMENPAPGWYEQDADAIWWHDFCLLSRSLVRESGVRPEQICAVGASTLGCDCLPVDENCRPLRKAILYGIDARSVEEIRELTEYYGEERTRELFGRPMCSGDVAAKILWLKRHEPEVYNKSYKFLTGSSFITAKLTGNYVIDRFLGRASFRPFYRPDGSIDEEMCYPVCRPDQLARGMIVTEPAGTVTQRAAEETGLKAGTLVITGTGDSAAEAVSTGVLSPGDLMIQFGSSLFFYYCTDRLIQDDRVRGNNFLIPGTYSVAAGTNNGGTLQNWYRDQLFPESVRREYETGENAFSLMMEGLEALEPGSGGLITLPYFAGERTPINDPLASGVVFGLTLQHTRQHLYRSALEGIGFTAAQHVDILREHGLAPRRILAAGGGTKNRLWMQMVADIIGAPLLIARETIGAAYGDALMAAIGAGNFKDFDDLSDVIQIDTVVRPDPAAHERYRPYRALFDELYRTNREAMHQLRAYGAGVNPEGVRDKN